MQSVIDSNHRLAIQALLDCIEDANVSSAGFVRSTQWRSLRHAMTALLH